MVYRRSQEIEGRLVQVIRLIRTGRYSTPRLAERLGVSIPTVSRCIESLKARGFAIRSVRERGAYRYIIESEPTSSGRLRQNDPGLAHASS
jgi:biotin operon repressor